MSANHLAATIEKGATGIARINGGVSLNDAANLSIALGLQRAV